MLAQFRQRERFILPASRRAAIERVTLTTRPDHGKLTPVECREMAVRLGEREDLWRDLLVAERGGRRAVRIAEHEHYDVWVVSWHEAEATDWHDHGGSSGGYVVTEGSLREFSRHGDCPAPLSQLRETGSAVAFGPCHIHDLQHAGGARAVSVHTYSPPITQMTYHELTPSGFRLREAVVD